MEKKIENKDLPAFACVAYDAMGGGYLQDGLTKREYFAAMAMQGIISGIFSSKEAYNSFKIDASQNKESVLNKACSQSIELADELIDQLNN